MPYGRPWLGRPRLAFFFRWLSFRDWATFLPTDVFCWPTHFIYYTYLECSKDFRKHYKTPESPKISKNNQKFCKHIADRTENFALLFFFRINKNRKNLFDTLSNSQISSRQIPKNVTPPTLLSENFLDFRSTFLLILSISPHRAPPLPPPPPHIRTFSFFGWEEWSDWGEEVPNVRVLPNLCCFSCFADFVTFPKKFSLSALISERSWATVTIFSQAPRFSGLSETFPFTGISVFEAQLSLRVLILLLTLPPSHSTIQSVTQLRTNRPAAGNQNTCSIHCELFICNYSG